VTQLTISKPYNAKHALTGNISDMIDGC